MDAEVREVVKSQLLSEQNSLCAYCMQKIETSKMKIEHWFPRNSDDANLQKEGEQKELDYNNLLAACKGVISIGRDKFEHCDASKKNQTISLNPLHESHIQQIYYGKKGEIFSKNTTHQTEINDVLNLNTKELKERRRKLLTTFRKGLSEKSKKGKTVNLNAELKKWQDQTRPFCMIIISYLEKKIAQN
jgi:uncharacterized protein (TIGR02646 family)